jgi:hypothetical protein
VDKGLDWNRCGVWYTGMAKRFTIWKEEKEMASLYVYFVKIFFNILFQINLLIKRCVALKINPFDV